MAKAASKKAAAGTGVKPPGKKAAPRVRPSISEKAREEAFGNPAPVVVNVQPPKPWYLSALPVLLAIAAILFLFGKLRTCGHTAVPAPNKAVADTLQSITATKASLDSLQALKAASDSAVVEAVKYADAAHRETAEALQSLKQAQSAGAVHLQDLKKKSDEIKRDIEGASTIQRLDSIKDRILFARQNAPH